MLEQLDAVLAFGERRHLRGRDRRLRRARDGRLVARARGDAARVRRRALPRPRHDASEGDPRARVAASIPSGRCSSPRRSRGRRSRRARTRRTSSRKRRAVRGDHGSRLGARVVRRARTASCACSTASRRSAAATRRCRRSASCPAVLMGIDATRLLERAVEMREACRCAEGNPGPRARASTSARAGASGRDKVVFADVRLRPLGGAADRRVDRQAGQGHRARAGRVAGRAELQRGRAAPRSRTSSARSSSAGSSPSPSRARSSASTRSTSPTCRRRRTRRTRCSRAATSSSSRKARSDELFAQAQRGRLRLHPGVHRSGARRRARSRCVDARARRAAASSRTASGRATSTRPGSSTRAARTPGSSSRSSTSRATSCRFPAATSASRG